MDTRFGRPRNATKVVWCAGNDDDFLLRLLVGRCATIPLPCGRGKGGGERMMAAILRWTTSVHPIDDACRTQFLTAGAHFAKEGGALATARTQMTGTYFWCHPQTQEREGAKLLIHRDSNLKTFQ